VKQEKSNTRRDNNRDPFLFLLRLNVTNDVKRNETLRDVYDTREQKYLDARRFIHLFVSNCGRDESYRSYRLVRRLYIAFAPNGFHNQRNNHRVSPHFSAFSLVSVARRKEASPMYDIESQSHSFSLAFSRIDRWRSATRPCLKRIYDDEKLSWFFPSFCATLEEITNDTSTLSVI